MEIANRIFEIVDKKYLEQKDFAKDMGISTAKVSNWRCGRSKSYSKYLPQIASILGTTTEYLLTGKSTPSIPDNAVIKTKGRHTLSADAVEVAFAYDDASPEIRAAVRRVLDIEDRSFPAKSAHPGEAM